MGHPQLLWQLVLVPHYPHGEEFPSNMLFLRVIIPSYSYVLPQCLPKCIFWILVVTYIVSIAKTQCSLWSRQDNCWMHSHWRYEDLLGLFFFSPWISSFPLSHFRRFAGNSWSYIENRTVSWDHTTVCPSASSLLPFRNDMSHIPSCTHHLTWSQAVWNIKEKIKENRTRGKRMSRGWMRLCWAIGQEARGRIWCAGSSIWKWGRTSLLCSDWNRFQRTGTDFPERLWSLP